MGRTTVKVAPLPFLAVHLDMAAVFLDDAISHGEAQAGAPAHCLGGKKGVEDMGQISASMPAPVSATSTFSQWPSS